MTKLLVLDPDVLDDPLIAALFSILQLDLPKDQRDRPSWDEYLMGEAILAAMRSSCPRARVGAVLALGRRIVATGYNGAPPKVSTCLEVGCKVVGGHCIRAQHAERSALDQASTLGISVKGATLYCTHKPCIHCANALIGVGIVEIVYLIPYRVADEASLFADEVLAQAGVVVRQLSLRNCGGWY